MGTYQNAIAVAFEFQLGPVDRAARLNSKNGAFEVEDSYLEAADDCGFPPTGHEFRNGIDGGPISHSD
jgi:hypothetical protein